MNTSITHIVYAGLGGTAGFALSLIQAERQSRFKHSIAFYGTEPIAHDYEVICKANGITYASFLCRPRVDRMASQKLLGWLKEMSPSIICLHTTTPFFTAICYKRLNRGVSIFAIEHNSNELKRPIDWLRSICFHLFFDNIVYLSELYNFQVKHKLGILFQTSKVTVIPNGIDLDNFRPRFLDSKLCIESKVIRLGMCSRLVKGKDFITLLFALSKLSDITECPTLELSIAGDGPERQALEALCLELNLTNVIFHGMVVKKDLADWYHKLDIYVHATVAETMSLAVMQAMACGIPTIASNVPGMSSIVPSNAGILVAPSDPLVLSQAIYDLVIDTTKRQDLGFAASEFASNNFDQSLALKRYHQLFLH